ncbi:MAG: RnfABCDGE type electron transport complex subunit D [Alphaproteobacteria bacterium]|nr:RnfABCDGE type electron transport complex subunit D [Alphaproteobacteria bacterium]
MTAATAPAADAAPKKEKKKRDPRNGLRTSATLATVFTFFGHYWFGFEQAIAQVFVALITGYVTAILFETVDAKANNRPMAYLGGGPLKFIDFLLSAHMTSITLSFLVYTNHRLWMMALAITLAIGSKFLFRVKVRGRYRHFMNPSNFAIAVVFYVWQWTGTLPWGMTAHLHGVEDWVLPSFIALLGLRLNLLYTSRIRVILAWIAGFVLQAIIRSFIWGSPLQAELAPATGVAYILFMFYMITDPMTSPHDKRNQIIFGGAIGLAYGLVLQLHIQFSIFYAVTLITAIRGVILWIESLREGTTQPAPVGVGAQAPTPALARTAVQREG